MDSKVIFNIALTTVMFLCLVYPVFKFIYSLKIKNLSFEEVKKKSMLRKIL